MHFFLIISTVYLLIIGVHLQSIDQQDDVPFNAVNPAHHDLRIAGLWLASHKYFEVDRRKGNDLSWKYAPRVFHKHFPVPRLKKLHERAMKTCDKGVVSCVRDIASLAKDSHSLFRMLGLHSEEEDDMPPPPFPFQTALELFQYRTTATYYMCLFTMQRSEFLMNYMQQKNCLHRLEKVSEKKWADIEVIDYRNDSYMEPFLCAQIQFCPDPCYGKKSDGSVPTSKALRDDQGNPCRHLKDKRCRWEDGNNLNFVSLQRNRFNISCNCQGERAGFKWNSRFGLCVDKDECEEEIIRCDKGRVCQNTPGNYTCICSRGYVLDKKVGRCVEQFPLPPHSRVQPMKTKPKKSQTALAKMIEYLLGLRKNTQR